MLSMIELKIKFRQFLAILDKNDTVIMTKKAPAVLQYEALPQHQKKHRKKKFVVMLSRIYHDVFHVLTDFLLIFFFLLQPDMRKTLEKKTNNKLLITVNQ